MDGGNGVSAAASMPQIAPLAKYKLVFLGDQVRSDERGGSELKGSCAAIHSI